MATFKVQGNLKGNPKLKPLNMATGKVPDIFSKAVTVMPDRSPNDGDDKISEQAPIPSIVNPPVDIPTTTPIGNTPDSPAPSNVHHADNSKAYEVNSPKATYPSTEGLEPFTRQPIKDEQDKQVDNSKANSPELVRSILDANPPGLEPLEQKPSVENTEVLPTPHPLNPVVASKAIASVLPPAPRQVANFGKPIQAPAKETAKVETARASILPPRPRQVANFHQPVQPMSKPTVPFDQLQCTDGEIKTAESYKSAYEIAGFKNHDYATSDISVYKSQIEKLNLGDLQAHAVEQGFLPTDNRPMLLERLLRKFREMTSPTRGMSIRKRTFDNIHSNPDKLAESLKILSKGR